MGLVSELRRRNVFRVAIAYVIIAWIILEAGDVLAPALHLPEWVVSALVFFLVLGFPLALIFAWAFELTPEGIKLEKHVDRTKSITHITGRKLDYVIIAVLSVALVYFAFDKFVLEVSRDDELAWTTAEAVVEQAAESTANSIAVLPFADLSPEGDQEYFSDGVSEEILNALAHIPELRVISSTSSFSFKGKGLDIPTVAKQLGVASILEGNVRKSGKRIRITAQLIDAKTDTHLWSETYERELEDVFAVQDEISGAIVLALQEHLGLRFAGAPRAIATANLEAHEAYLRGRYLVVQRNPAALEGAVREFQKAIALDSDYALAHAELAMATLLSPGYTTGLSRTEAIARAAPHAETAMALDPTLAEAHAATGFLLSSQRDWEEALKHYKQAIQINPNYSIVHNWLGLRLAERLGRYGEGFAAYERALQLDPLSIPTIENYALGLIERGRFDEAERELQKLASIAPGHYALFRGGLTSQDGKWANAILAQLDALRIDPEYVPAKRSFTRYLAIIGLDKEALAISAGPPPVVMSMLGRPELAITTAEAHLVEDPSDLYARRDLGLALASGGDYARARPILEEMWRESGGQITRNGQFRATDAAALIAIHREIGVDDEVAKLAAAITDNVRLCREAGIMVTGVTPRFLIYSVDYEEGLANYLSGEREKGLELIAKGAEDGWFIRPNEAYLQALYDDPGFAPIRASQEVRQARERERFLEIVCNDNPYEAVWQPAEGTCEQFAETGGS